jgi:hypothetical protein
LKVKLLVVVLLQWPATAGVRVGSGDFVARAPERCSTIFEVHETEFAPLPGSMEVSVTGLGAWVVVVVLVLEVVVLVLADAGVDEATMTLAALIKMRKAATRACRWKVLDRFEGRFMKLLEFGFGQVHEFAHTTYSFSASNSTFFTATTFSIQLSIT